MLTNVVATLKSHVDLFWLGRFDIDKKRTEMTKMAIFLVSKDFMNEARIEIYASREI
jgi:hypothetical protein